MRPLKKPKPKAPTILQQESSKLKQKLQLLRQQVIQKRQQKQMSKTATSLQSSIKPLSHNQQQNKLLSQTMKVNNSQFPDSKLHNMLAQMKMQTLEDKLKQKGVKTFERFCTLTQQQIDEWKDVAVGWRIKLKKQVRNCKQKKESMNFGNSQTNWNNNNSNKFAQQSNSKNKSSISQTKKQQMKKLISQIQQQPQQKQKNIQDIIKSRKQVQIFVPICRQIQQLNQEQQAQPQMTDQDQDVIIQSFMKVFQPRKGIIHNNSKQLNGNKNINNATQIKQSSKQKKVHWSKTVEQMEKQFMQKNHKTYPKQAIVKEALIHMHDEKITSSQSLPQNSTQQMIKYCWKCFRKIDIKHNIAFRMQKEKQTGSLKYFCSEKCKTLYNEQVDQFQQNLDQKEQHQQSYQKVGNNSNHSQEQDIETIDLSIL